MYTVQRRVCGANSLLLNFTDIPVRSEDARSVQKTPAGTPKMNILVHFWAASLQANWLLFRTSGIRAASATLRINLCAARSSCTLSVSLLKIYGIDTRREHKLTAGTPKNEHPCSFLGYKFAGANLILLETTALLGSSDTSSIYCSSGIYCTSFP